MTGGRVARAAGLISVLTVLSRLAGFARTAVFLWAVGQTALGGIYLSANTVPNIIFEIVAGGALASVVVPLLAGSVSAGDRDAVSATASALLTWAVALLVPLALVVALAADPIVDLLAGSVSPEVHAAGVVMLVIFAPQLPLYGAGIVLTGVLQAHHRFAWPVIAPLLSSVVVIGTYLVFAATQGWRADLPGVGLAGQLILAVGTTLGVVALSLSLLVPLRALHLRLRPTLAFAGPARSAVRSLALAGVATVGLQQIALLVTVLLANRGPAGPATFVAFTLAQTMFLLPWAVLAVPLATAAYPTLAASASAGDERRYQQTLAPAARAVVLLGCLGAAAMLAVAAPVAHFFRTPDAAPGIAGFAPGLLGYALFALLSRALYAHGEAKAAAVAIAAGWLTVPAAAVVLSATLPGQQRVLALSLANSAGMTVLGALLVAAVARRAGSAAVAGLSRSAGVGLLAGAVAAGAGIAVVRVLGGYGQTTPTAGVAVLQGILSGVVVGVVFLGVAYPLDRHDVRPLTVALLRRLRAIGRRVGPRRRDRKEGVSR
jgi:putative peptidoglycan lipid II flippase